MTLGINAKYSTSPKIVICHNFLNKYYRRRFVKVKITSIFNDNIKTIFLNLQNPYLLLKIASPILNFKTINPITLPNKWELNKKYKLKLYFFNFLPIGFHNIKVVKIDSENYEIVSNEHGNITSIWNHYIYLKKIDEKKTEYTDIVEIKAGFLTLFVYIFAHFFYRHRQKKWKKIIKENYNI